MAISLNYLKTRENKLEILFPFSALTSEAVLSSKAIVEMNLTQ